MYNNVYIIYKGGVPLELIRGDEGFRQARLENWRELFPEHHFSISNTGLALLEQHEY